MSLEETVGPENLRLRYGIQPPSPEQIAADQKSLLEHIKKGEEALERLRDMAKRATEKTKPGNKKTSSNVHYGESGGRRKSRRRKTRHRR
jgi:hypothetical protein